MREQKKRGEEKIRLLGSICFSSRSACSREHSGETHRWIVLKFGVLVQDVLGFNLAGGIVVLISGVSGIAAGQRVNKSVWLLEFFLFIVDLLLLSTVLVTIHCGILVIQEGFS